MIINTEHLTLRPLEKKDINPYYNIAQGKDIQKYVCNLYVSSKEEAKLEIAAYNTCINRSGDYIFAIEEKASKVLVGVIAAIKTMENTVDISLFIAEGCRNRGYAKEAINALLSKFIELKHSYKIEFFVADSNSPALMITKKIQEEAAKAGFKVKEKRFGDEGTDYSIKI